jgi:hypothetical protein
MRAQAGHRDTKGRLAVSLKIEGNYWAFLLAAEYVCFVQMPKGKRVAPDLAYMSITQSQSRGRQANKKVYILR